MYDPYFAIIMLKQQTYGYTIDAILNFTPFKSQKQNYTQSKNQTQTHQQITQPNCRAIELKIRLSYAHLLDAS